MEYKLTEIFKQRAKKEIYSSARIESAVLVPVFYKEGELYILFTKRSFKVMHHRGQVSFPGGAFSEADSSLQETALRESWEEIGLNPDDVRLIAELDDTLTTTSNYIIKPFLGLIPYPYDFTINPNEIAEIFEVPVSAMVNKANFKQESQGNEDGMEDVYFYKYKGKIIWGATANILKQILDTIESFYGSQE